MEILNQENLKPSLAIPKVLKVVAKGIENVSPYLVTRLATEIFSTPFRFKIPEREQFMLKSAQKHKLYVNKIKKEIEVLSYGFSKKKVLFVHGWSGRSTQLFAFADKLLENGFMIISFDGPSHGKSSGRKTMMPEFLVAMEEIQKKFGHFDSVVGHSFGGQASLNAASSFLNIKSIVVIGSGDKVSDIIFRFSKNLNLKRKTGKKLIEYFQKNWNLNVDDFASSKVVKKIEKPVLIIHDTLDGDVPVSCAYEIRQNLNNGLLLITNGLGHTRILRDKTVIEKTVNFIIKNS